MSGDWWRHFWLAFTKRGPYDPTGRDQELARLRKQIADHDQRWHVMASGLPRDTDEEKAAELLGAIAHVHNHIYGTWPAPKRIKAALNALEVPRGGAS